MSEHILATTTTLTATSIETTLTATVTSPIKVLSLQDFLHQGTRPQFLKEMAQCLEEVGTFYIKDHGIPAELTSAAMETTRDYFALPLEEKKKMLIGQSRHFRGYKLLGEEYTNNELDMREQLQFGPEQDPKDAFLPGYSPDYLGLQGPNQWPSTTLALLPSFQPSILHLMDHLTILSKHLMEAVALSLDLPSGFFQDLFGTNPYYRLKCAKYPSVHKQEQHPTIGCGAHKDTGFLTVLLQDTVGGLQGQDPRTGEWLDTKPVQDTLIVTMGEAMESLTSGKYHATVHRVLNNTSGKDRYSIPFFYDPSLTATIPFSLPSSVSPPSSSSKTPSSSPSQDALESMMETLDINSLETLAQQEGWSNGAHVFETVHRCHPEVYARWYEREL